jgi:UDP-N-acetylglucosamine 2-epimerase (non-hydrolysing)
MDGKYRNIVMNPLIQFIKLFGFPDYIYLQMNSLCTISNSGTISEESAILSFPAISLRQSMERPEAQDGGTIILSGFNLQIVLDSIRLSVSEQKLKRFKQIPPEYQVKDTSWRVLKLIMGNTHLSNRWHGIST